MQIEQLFTLAQALKSLFPERYKSFLKKCIRTINKTNRFLEISSIGILNSTLDWNSLYKEWDKLSTSLWLLLPSREISEIRHELELISSKIADLDEKHFNAADISCLLIAVKNKILIALHQPKFISQLNQVYRVSTQKKTARYRQKLSDNWQKCGLQCKSFLPEISEACLALASLEREEQWTNDEANHYQKSLKTVDSFLRETNPNPLPSLSIWLGVSLLLLFSLGLIPIEAVEDSGSEGNKVMASTTDRDDVDLRRSGLDRCQSSSQQTLKQAAVKHYDSYRNSKQTETRKLRNELASAKEKMIRYIRTCQADAEGQIYLNNYLAKEYLDRAFVSGQPARSYSLAVVVPLSRKMGLSDSFDALRGVLLAQSENNREAFKGKSPGQPLIFIKVFDDRKVLNNTATSRDLVVRAQASDTARSIVRAKENSNLVGVIGHFSSPATESAGKVYRAYNMPVITPSSTNIRQDPRSCMYGLGDLSFSRIANAILLAAPDGYALNILTHAERTGVWIDDLVKKVFQLRIQSILANICQPEGEKGRKLLALEPNIYRMAPDDNLSQSKIIEYIARINEKEDDKVGQISIIWEDNDRGFSALFRDAWIRQEALKAYKTNDCPIDSTNKTTSKMLSQCAEMILAYPGRQVIIVVPSSEKMEVFVKDINDIINRHPNRQNLHFLGADSMLTWDFSDLRYKGFVVAAAAEPLQEKVMLTEDLTVNLDFNWRAQMSRDAFRIIAENLKDANQEKLDPTKTRQLRSFILDHIATREYSFDHSTFGHSKFSFREEDHQREVVGDAKNFNVLLCLERPGTSTPWRNIDDPDDLCLGG